MENEENEIITKYPDMTMIPVDAFICYQQYRAARICWLIILLTLVITGIAFYLHFTHNHLKYLFCQVGLVVDVILIIDTIYLMRKNSKLQSASSRIRQFASHVEFYRFRCRSLRRVYKDDRLGLMSDSSYELELPVKFHQITWLHGGSYLTVAEPNDPPVEYEEDRGF